MLLPPKSAKSREILRKFELIVVQGHIRLLILVPPKRICNFLLVINSLTFDVDHIFYRFRDIAV